VNQNLEMHIRRYLSDQTSEDIFKRYILDLEVSDMWRTMALLELKDRGHMEIDSAFNSYCNVSEIYGVEFANALLEEFNKDKKEGQMDKTQMNEDHDAEDNELEMPEFTLKEKIGMKIVELSNNRKFMYIVGFIDGLLLAGIIYYSCK
jgi:hypothetical protein